MTHTKLKNTIKSCDPVPWDIARSREIGSPERLKRWRIFSITKSSSCPPLISPRLRRAAVPAARGRRPPNRLGHPRATPAGTSCPAGALNARPQQAAERPTPGRFPRHVQRGSGARWPPRTRTKAAAPPRASAPPRPTVAGLPADFQPPHAGWDQARSGWDPPFLRSSSPRAAWQPRPRPRLSRGRRPPQCASPLRPIRTRVLTVSHRQP